MANTAMVLNIPIVQEQEALSCPLSASQAYKLGVVMESMLLDFYLAQIPECRNRQDRELLNRYIARKKVLIAHHEKMFNYTVNCEVGRFYASGGTVSEIEPMRKEIAHTRSIIQRNLDNFLNQVGIWKEGFFVKNDLPGLCENTGEILVELYGRLARLYPVGEIRRSFEDMTLVSMNTVID